MITGKTRMADLIHLNYLLVSVTSRFGICLGFGDKSVEEICHENKINTAFFLEIVNSFLDKDYFPEKKLQNFSLRLITNYLGKTHRYYLDEKVPEIENLITEMVKECYFDSENAKLLNTFFTAYKEELTLHIKREDEQVFPYALYVENKFSGEADVTFPSTLPKEYSIKQYTQEHDDIEEKLYDLKNIIIKYLPASRNHPLCSKVISSLFILEKDINDHSRIEDKVLIPKVVFMEEKLGKQA